MLLFFALQFSSSEARMEEEKGRNQCEVCLGADSSLPLGHFCVCVVKRMKESHWSTRRGSRGGTWYPLGPLFPPSWWIVKLRKWENSMKPPLFCKSRGARWTSWQQLTLTLPADSEIGAQVFTAVQKYHGSSKKSNSYLFHLFCLSYWVWEQK